ncbi:MAG: NAD-dependent epimerase/dehydratase family protein [Verrucomicrobia bacterium]|nr:NAD-dependent epimerase/dehydratase family protein [Verrucomicrobiota bacterium]
MNCFVTGASGFVGANVVRELVARGHRVKVLVRAGGDGRGIADLDVERVTGDLSDGAKLTAAMGGCDWCFHVAAAYHLWMRDYKPMYATNVLGTRNVLEAAGRAGCGRIVYTSTVGCIGVPEPLPDGSILPSNEATPVSAAQMGNHYKLSKWQGEQIAFELARKGLPVVIVNPSGPIGPLDVKPTPTGQLIVDFLNGKLPAYIDTGLNWVHVRDVAVGHILAAANGNIGERYILGNREGNWTMKQTLEVLAEITGLPAPTREMPRAVALAAAYANAAFSFVTGIPPRVPLAGVRMSGHKMWFNPAKAIHELCLPQTPPRQAFAEAVEWFRANGHVKS